MVIVTETWIDISEASDFRWLLLRDYIQWTITESQEAALRVLLLELWIEASVLVSRYIELLKVLDREWIESLLYEDKPVFDTREWWIIDKYLSEKNNQRVLQILNDNKPTAKG